MVFSNGTISNSRCLIRMRRSRASLLLRLNLQLPGAHPTAILAARKMDAIARLGTATAAFVKVRRARAP